MKKSFKQKLTTPDAAGRTLATPAGPKLAKLVKKALDAREELLGTEMKEFLSLSLAEKLSGSIQKPKAGE